MKYELSPDEFRRILNEALYRKFKEVIEAHAEGMKRAFIVTEFTKDKSGGTGLKWWIEDEDK